MLCLVFFLWYENIGFNFETESCLELKVALFFQVEINVEIDVKQV